MEIIYTEPRANIILDGEKQDKWIMVVHVYNASSQEGRQTDQGVEARLRHSRTCLKQ